LSGHQFKIGSIVAFRFRSRSRNAVASDYRVIAHRPLDGGEHWYLVQSDLERHSRVVPESDLNQAGRPAPETLTLNALEG
jgi:hypothetical protein